jgi:hypothetical protein
MYFGKQEIYKNNITIESAFIGHVLGRFTSIRAKIKPMGIVSQVTAHVAAL